MDYIIKKITLPSTDKDAWEAQALWGRLFGQGEVDGSRDAFAGTEASSNTDVVYVLFCAGRVGASCRITRRNGTPLGELGDVSSDEAFRGQGFGKAVCSAALADFDSEGGEVLWLGTGNPIAANLYRELGFQFLQGANVMIRLKAPQRLTDWQKKWFVGGDATVFPGDFQDRVPMIPLILEIHKGVLYDANVKIFQTSIISQVSCGGLFPKYNALRTAGGEWFALREKSGAVGGLATVLPTADNKLQADFFTHPAYTPQAVKLLRALQSHAQDAPLFFYLHNGDAEKRDLLLSLGARETGNTKNIPFREEFFCQTREFILPHKLQ